MYTFIKKIALLLFSLCILLFSCEKKQSDFEFEQSVVYEIFPALIDSLHFDYRLKPPAPPILIYDKKGKIIAFDTTGNNKKIAYYEKRKAKLKADSVKLVIVIRDTVYPLGKEEKKQLLKHFSKYDLNPEKSNLSFGYKIELEKLIADKKLEFKYQSDFPKGSDIWNKEYSFHISGTTSLSRIQFDSTKSFGILRSGMGCGKLCGRGVNVFIRKKNGKWIIDKIITTTIS